MLTIRAAASFTVAQAVATQDGSSHALTGYVVGEPVSSTTVNRSGFTGDTAIAIADTAAETATAKMLYVQVTTSYRLSFGLKSNPSLMGKQVDVTGLLTAYFSHPGLTSPSSMALVGAPPPPPTTTTTGTPAPTGTGPYDSTYYASAMGTSGAALRSSLHSIIKTQTVLTYDEVGTALKDTDQDRANPDDVIEIYSGTSIAKPNNGGGVDQWNREHVWAKSHGSFDTVPGPGTDVHHLRPEDVTVNSDRGNLDFDTGGSAAAQCPDCWRDGDSFEPRDAVKGDVARMIFYLAIRYEGDDGFADLEPNENVNNGSAPAIGRLCVLKAWSAADPPDAFEMRRKQVIYDTRQHDRNPFIDHPEWVSSIWP
ncbi:MAG: endonuclease [Actinomycetota bacterium]|nr:endonuclease [Actinomycetota bacterium]